MSDVEKYFSILPYEQSRKLQKYGDSMYTSERTHFHILRQVLRSQSNNGVLSNTKPVFR